ncbi:MAG TPA: type II toxin-antitoxin system PemK/MazF family toxin [Caulobacteraceae bacterium]
MRSPEFRRQAHLQSLKAAIQAPAPGPRPRRGEVWRLNYPDCVEARAVVVQDDSFDGTSSIAVCGLVETEAEAPLFRPLVQPSVGNGLVRRARLMVGQITNVSASRFVSRLGALDDADLRQLNRALLVFMGLADHRPKLRETAEKKP